MKKLLFILPLIFVLIIGLVIHSNIHKEKVKVYSVEKLLNNADWAEDVEETQTGTATSDSLQEVYLNPSTPVKKIYVKKGDYVKKGQKLVKYNNEETELDLALEELQLESAAYKIEKMENELKKLRKKKGSHVLFVHAADTLPEKPAANQWLMYNGIEQIGVTPGVGYSLSDNYKAIDAGTYTVTATPDVSWEDGSSEPLEITYVIEKKQVEIPKPKDLVYNGKIQTALESARDYTVEDGTGCLAGDYQLTATLKDPKNFTWAGREEASLSIPFTIAKAPKISVIYPNTKITSGEKIPTNLIYKGLIEGDEIEPPILDTSEISGPGIYTLAAHGGKAPNYEGFDYVPGTLVVQPKPVRNILTLSRYRQIISGQKKPYLVNLIADDGEAEIEGAVLKEAKSVIFRQIKNDTVSYAVFGPESRFPVHSKKTYSFSECRHGKLTISGKDRIQKTGNYKAMLNGIDVTGFSKWKVLAKSPDTKLYQGRLTLGEKKVLIEAFFDGMRARMPVSMIIKKKEKEVEEDSSEESDIDEPIDEGTDKITKEELKEQIAEKEAELAEAKTDYKELQIAYQEHKMTQEKTLITANFNGKVIDTGKTSEGQPALTIRASNGMSVKTLVNELKMDKIKVGGKLYCTNVETGEEMEAEITEISDYPVDHISDGMQNPNSSYFPVTAYIADAKGLHNHDSVNISYNPQSMGLASEDTVVLHRAYLLNEGRQYYVYKRDKKKRLRRQNVKIASIYGSYIQIAEGVRPDDYLAFPYGKDVREGARTVVSNNSEEVVY